MKPAARSVLTWAPVNRLIRAVGPTVLPPGILHRLPVRADAVEGRAAGASFVLGSPHRCTNAKELYWGRGRLPDPAEQWTLDVFVALSRRADVVVDVGAYTGIFTVAALRANPDARGHALEMLPETFELLTENCSRNGVADRATCHHAAVGDPGRELLLPRETGRASLPTGLSVERGAPGGTRIPVRSLDEFADAIPPGSRVALKIDVEGTEAEVFEHGWRFVEAFRPAVVCEVLGAANPGRWSQRLSSLGYGHHLITDTGPSERPAVEPDADHRNWLSSPRSEPPVM